MEVQSHGQDSKLAPRLPEGRGRDSAGDQSPSKGSTARSEISFEIRRVVTGKDATGKAVAIIDGPAPNVQVRRELGNINTVLWVTDSMPADLSSSNDAGSRKVGVEPPADGNIFRASTRLKRTLRPITTPASK
jgi:hypothetical protein